MQQWEYLQLYKSGNDRAACVFDNTGRTWVTPATTELRVDPAFGKEFLRALKAPYAWSWRFPPEVLDELGAEGWVLTLLEGQYSIFRRPKA